MMAGIDYEVEIIDQEYRDYMAAHVRIAPRVNVTKLAWRAVLVVLAVLQWGMSAVYGVWAGIAGYPRGRKR
jgi:hypothetical protein